MDRTAVVILNWNGLELLKQYVPKVLANSPEATVVVADNASSDGSVQWLEEHHPDVKIIAFKENYGYAGGYNRAVELLDGYSRLVLLNSDAFPAARWLQPLEKALDQNDVAAAQPKILSARNPHMFEYAGAAGGFLDINGYPYCRGRIFDTVEADAGQYDEGGDIFWASGAALAIKRAAYLEAGGLDELFFAHMEEIDLCWRLKLAGKRIVYVPGSKVYHLGGASLDASSPHKTYLNFRNNLLMLYKNLPKCVATTGLLLRRRLLDTLAWARYAATGKFGHAAAIVKAHRDFAKMRANYTQSASINMLRQSPRVNILTQYYLKRHRTFDRLPYRHP